MDPYGNHAGWPCPASWQQTAVGLHLVVWGGLSAVGGDLGVWRSVGLICVARPQGLTGDRAVGQRGAPGVRRCASAVVGCGYLAELWEAGSQGMSEGGAADLRRA